MPRLNVTGDALMGIGGLTGNISVNGSVPASLTTVAGGDWRWLTSGIIAGQADTGSGFGLYKVTLPNTLAALETPIQAGINFSAGNSVWAVWRLPENGGVRTSVTNFGPFTNYGLGDVDFEGNFGFIQNRAEGRGLITYTSTGTRLASWDVQISFPTIRLQDGLISYSTTGGQWHLRDVATGTLQSFANQAATVSAMVPAITGGITYVLEQRDADITLRPATSGTGYVIAAAPAFNSDVIELSAGVLRIAWSLTSGEGPTQLRMMDLNLNTGSNTLWSTASGSLVSSAGPTLTAASFPVGPIEGAGRGANINVPKRDQPVVGKDGRATQSWFLFFDNLRNNALAPVNLSSGVTGTLDPDNGGTGTDTGTDVLLAENLIGTVPQAAKWTQFDTSAVGTQNNFYFNDRDAIRADNATALTLTGLIAGVPGQRLVIVATDAAITLSHESASSTAANRILTSDGLAIDLAAGEGALLSYDGTSDRWRVLFTTGSSVDPSLEGYWSPLCAGDSYYTPTLVLNAGTWAPVTNGDPVTPEIVFDSNGDCVVGFTPGTGPYMAPIVTSEDATVAVWTPTP
jgi:hypothetical protein